ncbi:MAG: Gfo/Idh/MocA family oxidoreductase [Sedimentisphaerales bacterium]|nr:Gfo/Idh/MocA family oxidoreductase [Sedimentisphaerales bacterium]
MNHSIKLVLVGMGGYGGFYVRELLHNKNATSAHLVGIVEPRPENCYYEKDVRDRNIPVFSDFHTLYSHLDADLVVISSPIQFHCEQTCLALTHNSHVLCEKPICATLEEARKMVAARDAGGKHVAVGFQWCYSPAIKQLKEDIAQGRFGTPKRLKSTAFLPRGLNYYQRNDWAGKIRDSQGRWVLDSPVNNATAHYLFNMLYVLGDKSDLCANIQNMEVELYRANNIESFDTAALRIFTQNGVEILFFTSHATQGETDVQFYYEFEDAVVETTGPPYSIVAKNNNGIIATYGDPNLDEACKLWQAIAMTKEGIPPACGLETAITHTLCIHAIHHFEIDIIHFPLELLHKEPLGNDSWIRVEGLFDAFNQCYINNVLPYEIKIPWSKPAHQFKYA